MNFVGAVLKNAVTGAVAGHISGTFQPDGRSGRGPELVRVQIADKESLAHRVHHRVVRPAGDLVFTAVERPGIARARFGNEKSEIRIGDDVDPGGGGSLAFFQNDRVFSSVFGETAHAVKKFQQRHGEWSFVSVFQPQGFHFSDFFGGNGF